MAETAREAVVAGASLAGGEEARVERLRWLLSRFAATLANDDAFPREVLDSLAAEGFLTEAVPRAQGGGGASVTLTAQLIEVMASASPTLGWLMLIQYGLQLMLPTATGARCTAYFDDIVSSRALLAGSTNTRGLRARREGGQVVVSGTIRFCSGAPKARWISSPAQVASGDGQATGCILMIPGGVRGIRCVPADYLHSLRGSLTGLVILEDVVVPVEHVHPFVPLDDPGSRPAGCRYFGVWQSLLLQHAVFLGTARGALAAATDRVRARGWDRARPTSEQTLIEESVGAAATDLIVARALFYSRVFSMEAAARAQREHAEASSQAHDALLAEAAGRTYCCVSRLMELMGGSVLMDRNATERFWRDIQLARAAEGSRMRMAQVALGRQALSQPPQLHRDSGPDEAPRG